MNIFYTCFTLVSALITISSYQLGCERVRLRGNVSRWRNFSSPNHSASPLCYHYSFIAAQDEIVQIHFKSFNIGLFKERCSGDRLKVDLHGYTKTGNSLWTGSLCGFQDNIPKYLFSSGSKLSLELDVVTKQTSKNSSYGFTASYRFIKRSAYSKCKVNAGNSSHCDFEFTSNGSTKSGKFFSPGYPSGYRNNRTIRYCFRSRKDERINLILNEVKLSNSDKSCLDQRDVIRLYEGEYSNRTLGRVICNEATSVEYLSNEPVLILELQAATEWPPRYFVANYSFISFIHSSSGERSCNTSISGDAGSGRKNLSTVEYSCRYEFEARGPSRIKLALINSKITGESVKERNVSCIGDSRAKSLSWSQTHMNQTSFCKNDKPIVVMSSGPRLTLTVNGSDNSTEWNLLAEYSFVRNFGVKMGFKLEEFECGFLYDAEDWPSGGYFTSPNYPSLYPRDTECHYFFQGMDWQRVNISFNYLDVQGTPPCDMSEESDYLEFSNCLTADGKLPRRCGQSNFVLISDKKYFRVTFKSNGKLDATGFNASSISLTMKSFS